MHPARWTFADAAKMALVADQLARLRLGMPISKAEITGRDGAPLLPMAGPKISITYLSDAESRQLI